VTVVDHPDVDVEACAALAERLGAVFRVRSRAVRRHSPAAKATPTPAADPACSSPSKGD
jgi:hypothetical protein